MQRLKTALAVGTIIASYGLVMGTAEAQDKEISLRDQKVADVKKHEMTAEERIRYARKA